MPIPYPVDEEERLAALRRYAVLDTPPEAAFDRITRLAAVLLGTPITLVSLVDDERQWFKSRYGLDAPETPREVAFCAHAIMSNEVFTIPDATKDDRFRENPLVTSGPEIRFYAGAPLTTSDGYKLGTLCAIDRVPRELSAEHEEVLRDLAQLVIDELELRRATRTALDEVQERKQAESRVREQNQYLAALHETTLGLMQRLDVDDLLEAIVTRAGALVGTTHGFVRLYEPEHDTLVLKIGIGDCAGLVDHRVRRGEGVAGRVWDSGEPLFVNDYQSWEGRLVQGVAFDSFKALAVVPLMSGDDVVGMIGLAHIDEKHVFRENEIILLDRFARLAVLALDNARLHASAQSELSERRRAELELHGRNVELEEMIAKLESTRNQLVTQEKLASLGALTAGIAHEMRNPLNFVKNFAEVSIELIEDLVEEHEKQADRMSEVHARTIKMLTEDLSDNLARILHHGARTDSIVENMLLHSRGVSGKREMTDVNRLLRDYLNLAYQGMRANHPDLTVVIEADYDDEVGLVAVVPQDVSRVFLNILQNALDAVRSRSLTGDAGYVPTLRVRTERNGERVSVRIEDNGGGIPPDMVEKVFEPFFTTKAPGEGTGLGLSLSYDIIVNQHGGSLSVHSEPGRSTCFTLALPAPVCGVKENT